MTTIRIATEADLPGKLAIEAAGPELFFRVSF